MNIADAPWYLKLVLYFIKTSVFIDTETFNGKGPSMYKVRAKQLFGVLYVIDSEVILGIHNPSTRTTEWSYNLNTGDFFN